MSPKTPNQIYMNKSKQIISILLLTFFVFQNALAQSANESVDVKITEQVNRLQSFEVPASTTLQGTVQTSQDKVFKENIIFVNKKHVKKEKLEKEKKVRDNVRSKFLNKIDEIKSKKKINKGLNFSEYDDLKKINQDIIAETKLATVGDEQIEPSVLMSLEETYLPSDPMLTEQWYLFRIFENTKGLFLNKKSENIPVVAVIDAGIDFSNKDIELQKWSGDTCVNEFFEKINEGCLGGYDFVDNDNDPSPADGATHGNSVASLIGAQNDNDTGIASISRGNVKIMSLRVANGGLLETDNVVRAIYFAVHNGANIINMSFAGPTFSQSLLDAIKYAESHGVVMVAAAGNYGKNLDVEAVYPASYKNKAVITVAAINENGLVPAWSNYGKAVDLFAPGTNILALTQNGVYTKINGTSFSTPLVTSYLADALSKNIDTKKALRKLPNVGNLANVSKNGTVLGGGNFLSGVQTSKNEIQTTLQKDSTGKYFDPQTKGGEYVDPKNYKPNNSLQAINYSLGLPVMYAPGTTASPGPSVSANSSVTFSWGSGSGAAKYGVYIRDLTTNTLILDTYNNPITGNSFTHNYPYVAGRAYRWNMNSFDSSNNNSSAYTTAFNFTITVSQLSAPSSLTPGSTAAYGPVLSGTTQNLSWNSISGAAGYFVEYTNISTGAINNYSTAYTYQSVPLVAGQYYKWRVATINSSSQYGSYSNFNYFQAASAAPTNTAPSTPNVSVPSTGTTGVSLTANFVSNDPEGNSIMYFVNWNGNGGSTTYQAGYYSSGTTGTATFSYPSAGTYCVKVYAVDNLGATSGTSPCYNITISAPATAGAPTLSVTPSTQTITSGTNANFTLTTTNVSSCSISGGGFTNVALSSVNSGYNFAPTTSYTYTINCAGTNGTSIARNFTVNVNAATTNETPTVPVLSGTGAQILGTAYVVGLSSTDPQADQINYFVMMDSNSTTNTQSFGPFGPYTGGINLSHIYPSAGSYCVKSRAVDTKGNSSAWSGCHNVTITSATPPATPETPTIPVLTGTRAATVGTAYVLSIYATDPQTDQIKYEVSYDPAYGNWTSQLYNSGLTLNLSIPYNTAGSYCIKVRAIDTKSNTSAYSACHTVVVSAANTAVPAIASISSQTTGNAFNLSLSGLTVGQVLNLQSSTGSMYPKQINVSASSMSVPVKVTSTSGSINIRLLNGSTLLTTTNTFTLTAPCSSTLQDISTLESLCTPFNTALSAPVQLSPGIDSTFDSIVPVGQTGTAPANQPVINSTTQTFSWNAVAGASRYALYVRDLNTGNLVVAEENLTSTSFTYNYLLPNNKYKWNVRAIGSNNLGGWISDGFYFGSGGFSGSIDSNLSGAVEFELLDVFGRALPNASVSASCDPSDPKCNTANQLADIKITDVNGKTYYVPAFFGVFSKGLFSIDFSGLKASTGGTIQKITATKISFKMLTASAYSGKMTGFTIGAANSIKDLVTGLVFLVFNLDTIPAALAYVWNNPMIILNGMLDGLENRAIVVLQMDENNYVTMYNGGAVVGQTTADIAATFVPVGTALKGIQITGVVVDMTSASTKAASLQKLAPLLELYARVIGGLKDLAIDTRYAKYIKSMEEIEDLAQDTGKAQELRNNVPFGLLGKEFEGAISKKLLTNENEVLTKVSGASGKTVAELQGYTKLSQVQIWLSDTTFFIADDVFIRFTTDATGKKIYYALASETKLSATTALSTRQAEFLQALQSGKKVFGMRSKKFIPDYPQGIPLNIEGYVKISSDGTVNGVTTVIKLQ